MHLQFRVDGRQGVELASQTTKVSRGVYILLYTSYTSIVYISTIYRRVLCAICAASEAAGHLQVQDEFSRHVSIHDHFSPLLVTFPKVFISRQVVSAPLYHFFLILQLHPKMSLSQLQRIRFMIDPIPALITKLEIKSILLVSSPASSSIWIKLTSRKSSQERASCKSWRAYIHPISSNLDVEPGWKGRKPHLWPIQFLGPIAKGTHTPS